MPIQKFFQAKLDTAISHPLDTGYKRDSLFRAIAIGLLDNAFTQPHIAEQRLQSVLTQFYCDFPEHKTSSTAFSYPYDHIKQLLNTVPIAKLVQKFAFNLRQIAIDAFCQHPTQYARAFMNEQGEVSPETMRKPTTYIDHSAITALSQALSIPIWVNVLNTPHAIPLRQQYHQDIAHPLTNPPIKLQLRNGNFMPLVTNKYFDEMKSQLKNMTPLCVIHNSHDPSLDYILGQIAEHEKQCIEKFKKNYQKLSDFVTSNGIKKNDLLMIYTQTITPYDYNMEYHNSATILEEVVPLPLLPGHDQQVIQALIFGIARAMSIGQIDPTYVFNCLEQSEEDRPSFHQ